MIHKFRFRNKTYSYYNMNELTDQEILSMVTGEVSPDGYLMVPLSFDIETTSFFSEKYQKDLATMYIWQFGIRKNTIMGRTWEEFLRLLDLISSATEKKLLLWIQNFPFEFQFIKSIINWNLNTDGYPDIFAKTDRSILNAKYKNIEFRDSLALTGMSLKSYQKNYKLNIGKLDGDLDYKKPRHYDTPLTNQELAYCINDVQVLNEWQEKYIFPYYLEQGLKVPLTSTGIVRARIKAEFNKMSKEERKKMLSKIRNAQPSREMYIIFRQWLFRGGLVHANTVACNELIEEPADGLDLKSAHPTHMILDKFPYKFNRRNVSCFQEVLEEARQGEYGFWGIFVFHNIRCKGWHCLESKNKIIESTGAVFENGRMAKADMIKVALTEIDYFNYLDMYTWEGEPEVKVLYQAHMDYLPDYVRRVVMEYFQIKETIDKSTMEYGLAKRQLNSCFGMAATSLPEREVVYNQETNQMELSTLFKTYDELIRYLIMLPQWAIYIAAYTRRDIVESLVECGIDSIYYDTDSNKLLNYKDHKEWFDDFNKRRREKIEKINFYEFDKNNFLRLGSFEHEYTAKRFKVQGAKRYLVETDEGTEVVVAGMVKGSLERYATYYRDKNGKLKKRKKPLDVFELFKDDLELSREWSEKQTAIYYDQAFTDQITDYLGVTRTVQEASCVSIIDIPFHMSIEEEFLLRAEELRKERERMIYHGTY